MGAGMRIKFRKVPLLDDVAVAWEDGVPPLEVAVVEVALTAGGAALRRRLVGRL